MNLQTVSQINRHLRAPLGNLKLPRNKEVRENVQQEIILNPNQRLRNRMYKMQLIQVKIIVQYLIQVKHTIQRPGDMLAPQI